MIIARVDGAKRWLAAVLMTLLCANVVAQQFPRLQGENLNGQQVMLPDAAAGKVAVLIFGFTRGSQTTTGSWAKRIQADYGKSPSFVWFQLPVLEEAPRLIRGMIVSGMKKGVAEDQRPYFVPVMHGEAELKKLVGFKEADDAYLVVLDRAGKVAYQTHGAAPVEPGYSEFRARLDGLLK